MPRLYHLVSDLGPSAAGKQLSLLAPELAARGVAQAVGVLGETAPFGPVVSRTAPVQRFTLRKGWLDLRVPQDVLRAVTVFRPDAVAAWGPAAVRWAAGCQRAGGGPRFAAVSASAAGWFGRRALPSAAVCLPFTTAESARYITAGVPAEYIRPLPPAVTPTLPTDPTVARTRLNIPADARLIVAAGGFDNAADLRAAVWAFEVLKYTDPTFHMVVLGDGLNRAAVERFTLSLGRDDVRTTFAGLRDDVPAIVAAADAVWITHRTGGWNLALESLAAGVPVVAVRNPDLAGLVPDADQVPAGDKVRMAGRTAERLTEPPPAVREFPVAATADAFLASVFGEEGWNGRAIRAE